MASVRALLLMCALSSSWWIDPISSTTIPSISKPGKPAKQHSGFKILGSKAVLKRRQADSSPCSTADRVTTTVKMTTSYEGEPETLEDPRGRYEYQLDAWFRLDGEGGTEILDSKPMKTNICNSRYPGYIKYQGRRQTHSSPGTLTEATLCHLSGFSDCATPSPILIQQCDNYVVYKIKKVNIINQHADFFCTQKADQKPRPLDPCKTRERLTTTIEMTTSFEYDRSTIVDPRARLEYQLNTWFRLNGEGGTEILDSKPLKTHICNARYPGYIKYQGERPAYQRPPVQTEATLCHLSDKTDCVSPSQILIHKCKNYFVYKITKVNVINEYPDFFCTQKSSQKPKPSDPCKTSEILHTDIKMTPSFGYSADEDSLSDPRGMYEYSIDEWFRLDGEGGTEILDSKPLKPYICNARYPGYISYKTRKESNSQPGTQTEATICHLSINSDCTSSSPILIRQCKNYLVYKITKMNLVLQYADFFCTQKGGQPPVTSDPCSTREVLLTTTKMTTSFAVEDRDPESDRRGYYEFEVSAWFRLEGDGGTEILTQKPQSTNKCSTRYPGWIKYDGDSPDSKSTGWEGKAKVCHVNLYDDCYSYVNVLVHKCQDYLVYKSTKDGLYFDPLQMSFCTQTERPPTTPRPTTPTTKPTPSKKTTPTTKPTPSKKTTPTTAPTPTARPIPTNACASNPCGRHGTCYNVGAGFECVCQSGYTGRHCKTNINDCESFPCYYGGTCTDGIADYTCTCPPGLTGKNCEINENDCSSNPCHNGGKCVDGIDGYYCFCTTGYSGPTCQTNEDNCLGGTRCQNGGTCHDGINTFKCECANGFEGKLCEQKTSPCRRGPCRNGGTCKDSQTDQFTCTCPPGFTGRDCGSKLGTACDSNPCKNGATCTNAANSYVCTCLPGWSGADCDNDDKIQKYADEIDDLVQKDNTFSMDDLYEKVDDVLDDLSDIASDDNDDSLTDKVGDKIENSIKKYLGKKLNKVFDKVKDKLSSKFCGGTNLGSAANNFKKTYNKCLKNRRKKCREEGKKEREENGEDTDEESENEEENEKEKEEEEKEKEKEEEEEEEEEKEEESCSDKCSELQSIANGKMEVSKFECGYTATFSCDEGYQLKGCESDKCKITCERGQEGRGQWSSQPPTCEKKTCGGFITLSSSNPQTELSFTGTDGQNSDCTWIILSASQDDLNVNFQKEFKGASSRATKCDSHYVEIGFGPETLRFCHANQGVQRSFSNMITIKFHSTRSRQVKLNIIVSIVNDFYESSAKKRSFLSKRNGSKRKLKHCEVHVDSSSWPKNPPILADPTTKKPIFPKKEDQSDPTTTSKVKMILNSEFKALCSQTNFDNIKITKNHHVPLLTLDCKINDQFVGKYKVRSSSRLGSAIDKIVEFPFYQLNCKDVPKTEVIKLNGPVNEDHKLTWNFNDFTINVIDEIKYDANNKRPVYAKETVRGETLFFQKEGNTNYPNFKKTPLITPASQMDPKIYPKEKQREIFETIDPVLESKIDCCHDKYFAHGHLVPKADFFYKSWRDATFYMTNVAPQWQSINAGNWVKVENAVRKYAVAKGKDMTVTTGVYGTLKIDGKDIVLPGNIPVPSHFWKVFYDPDEDAAVAFVIVNSPHADVVNNLPTGSDKLCTAQCDLLHGNKFTPIKGLLMCCSPTDLKRSISDVPTYSPTTKDLFDSDEMKKALKSEK